MILLQQMIVLFILMVIGYYCRRTNMFNPETSNKLSAIVVNIANPALILSGSINRTEVVKVSDLTMTLGIAVLLFAGLILAALVLVPVLRVPKKDKGVYKTMTIFSNIGFMGFPIINAIYGSNALLYASIFLIPYNLLIYTYGIAAMSDSEQKTGFQWKYVVNIGVISCIISLIIAIFHIQFPSFVGTTVESLSNLTAPLSMMVIGASMAEIKLIELFTDVRMLIFSGIKLLAIPVLGMLILRIFISDPLILGVCMVVLSTPVGSMTAMLAQQYGGDYEMASKGVALTTLLSVATMPLVSLLVG